MKECPNCGCEEFENGYCPDCEFGDDTNEFDTDDDNLAYARMLNRQGVERECQYCKTKFLGMPDHGVCNSCADAVERGEDMEY